MVRGIRPPSLSFPDTCWSRAVAGRDVATGVAARVGETRSLALNSARLPRLDERRAAVTGVDVGDAGAVCHQMQTATRRGCAQLGRRLRSAAPRFIHLALELFFPGSLSVPPSATRRLSHRATRSRCGLFPDESEDACRRLRT